MTYKLLRQKRKTLTIQIRDGEITVKAPMKLPTERIESFVAQKSAWIDKKLFEYAVKTSAVRPAIDYSSVMYHGAAYPITVTDKVKRISLTDGELLVPVKYGAEEEKKRAIAAWYKRVAKKELAELLDSTSKTTGLTYKSFATTNARGKWGSCDGDCNIRLNWRLVMLDCDLALYVVSHELAHTVHHDHSKAFWSTVGTLYPDYKSAVKRLKTNSVLITLYR